MRADCIAEVSRAIGRSLNQAEERNIEARISRSLRTAARADPAAFGALSPTQRLAEAAKLAAQELVHEAQLKKVRTALTILAHDRIETYSTTHPEGRVSALDRILAPRLDGRDGVISAESRATTIRNLAIAEFSRAIEQLGPKWLGISQNAEGARALIMELRGKDSGLPEAKSAAQAFASITERLRKQFNASGGDIGKLEDWAHPQAHSQHLIAQAGKEPWIDFTLPRLDRSRYVKEDGAMMSEPEVREFLAVPGIRSQPVD